MKLKGSKGQIDHSSKLDEATVHNELIGFKCLHYSVTESNGTVEITILKKNPNIELMFGYRTVDDTATAPKDYTRADEQVTMKKGDTEFKINIPIIDDEEWNPDLDFFVELYDVSTGKKYDGDDTQCKVSILDEDFPGTLGFEHTEISVKKGQDHVDIGVQRVDGSDGAISCMIKTEYLSEVKTPNSANEFDDYLPKYEKVYFQH